MKRYALSICAFMIGLAVATDGLLAGTSFIGIKKTLAGEVSVTLEPTESDDGVLVVADLLGEQVELVVVEDAGRGDGRGEAAGPETAAGSPCVRASDCG